MLIGYMNILKKSSIHFSCIITRIDNYLFKRLFLTCVKCSKFSGANAFLSVDTILPVPRKSLSDAKDAGSIQKIAFAIVASKGNL